MAAGFIGLGNIGSPMARRLAEASPGTLVFDVMPDAVAALADVAGSAVSPAAVAQACDRIAICVRDDSDVEAVLSGPSGVLSGVDPAAKVLIAIHSTISLSRLEAFASQAAAVGAELVDAAVTGGAEVAAQGKLTCMVGGSDGIGERIAPLVEPYAATVIHAGPLGAGMKLKVANNLVTYTQLAIGVEAMRLARLTGADPQQLLAVMRGNGNLTSAMAAFLGGREAGIAAGGGDTMLAMQSGLASLAEKDLDHALSTAQEAGFAPVLAPSVRAAIRQIIERIDA